MIEAKAALSLDEGDHMPMLEKMVSHKSIEERGPQCTKCESKMRLSHVTAHSRVGVSFERRTFICLVCGHAQTYTMGNTSRSTSSKV